MDNLWQSPYVNVFKHFELSTWKKANKEGDVVSQMDKTVKGTVYRINGCIPAGNYIQVPKTSTHSLGLTGKYMYLLFKPMPGKHFVVHLDVSTADNLVVRVSFSSLFKEFKSTSTWLQFPFVCNPPQGPVPSYISEATKDQSGPAPLITRWCILCLDLQSILSVYLNRQFACVKTIRLCANMFVKNVFTSSVLYDPGLSMSEAKRLGLLSQGVSPLPRDLCYPVPKGGSFLENYDWIRFPVDKGRAPFDSIQPSTAQSKTEPVVHETTLPKRNQPKIIDASKVASDGVSIIDKLTETKKITKKKEVTPEVPDFSNNANFRSKNDVHVYAFPEAKRSRTKHKHEGDRLDFTVDKPTYKSLDPDPIMKLKRIIGFGGATHRDVLWSPDGENIVYPCHAVVVSMCIKDGSQNFFIGHTDKVSCLSMSTEPCLLASGQTGQMTTVRVWKYSTLECQVFAKAHVHSLRTLSFAPKGDRLCAVGKDSHCKNLVVVWNTSQILKQREMTILAKAHTDIDITRVLLPSFDNTRMVSCGRDNVRLWRVKEGALRSAPINLGDYQDMEFTDICFQDLHNSSNKDSSKHLLYACTKSGHIFEMNHYKLTVEHVRRLLPSKTKIGKGNKLKQASQSGSAISINTIHMNDTFCVTGSNDGYLRLWPLDFAHVYMEAEHEGAVMATRLSPDGLMILAGTDTGNLGILDVTSRAYTTLMRSHTGRVLCFAVDPLRKQIATVSEDHTIRVWDVQTLQQLYDFSAPDDSPCTINYHPRKQIFACGFQSGAVRVFNVDATSLVAEHRQLRGEVTGLVYSPDGSRLFACCSMGVAAIFDACTPTYKAVRVIAGLVARGQKFGPQALAVSPDGRRVAFVGPTEFTVTIADSKCLDELVRVDMSSTNQGTGSKMSSAVKVAFAPSPASHLLVTTSNNKVVKLNSSTGVIVDQVDHIHRSMSSALTVSNCGRYFATGGDKTVKIWDYGLKLDINFQVFIGHSENVSRILFTPDILQVLTSGEAIYMWDFLAKRPPTPPIEGRMELTDILEETKTDTVYYDVTANSNFGQPHNNTEVSVTPNPVKSVSPRSDNIDALSSIHGNSDTDEPSAPGTAILEKPEDNNELKLVELVNQEADILFKSKSDSLVFSNTCQNNIGAGISFPRGLESRKKTKSKQSGRRSPGSTLPPDVFSHYKHRDKIGSLAQRRYSAPPNQAGLKLKSVLGFNSNGRNNMVWHPDTGFFAYSSGCVIVIEDLNTGEQKFIQGHTEEVSCLALQHDSQVLVSVSPGYRDSPCQLCVWDTNSLSCVKQLTHHKFAVQCLAFSTDDRFLISAGDYRECSIVVWDTSNYQIVATSVTAEPIHALSWDPTSINEFISVGELGTVLFWLLEDSPANVSLNVCESEIPQELKTAHKGENLSFTSLAYSGSNIVYVGTNSGKVAAWNTQTNLCFLHWDADTGEITKVVSRHSVLMTASTSGTLRLWSVGSVANNSVNTGVQSTGITMEDEMSLDGPVTCTSFDDLLDMGIVGTSTGTLWYINWAERSSIRLVSGHKNKINEVMFTPNSLLLTAGQDGSLRVWSISSREQALQFQVVQQACTSLAAAPGASDADNSLVPLAAGGYSDGTIRVFDINKVEMIIKMQPHARTVTALAFTADGVMLLSGGSDGQIAISSPNTGMTVRVLPDHKGVAISNFDTIKADSKSGFGVNAPNSWLASSMDRRVSVWAADWSKDFCELVDWLTFPAPAAMPDGSRINRTDPTHYDKLPPTLAKFSPFEPDVIVYTGYGMERSIQFYSISQRKVIRSVGLTHWSLSMDVTSDSSLIAVGISDRLLKLMDYHEGNFQDFIGHSDSVSKVKFSPSGNLLLTTSHNELFLWEVLL